jgi:hypothetical protein
VAVREQAIVFVVVQRQTRPKHRAVKSVVSLLAVVSLLINALWCVTLDLASRVLLVLFKGATVASLWMLGLVVVVIELQGAASSFAQVVMLHQLARVLRWKFQRAPSMLQYHKTNL